MPQSEADRRWVADAVQTIRADARRSADTHLIRLALPPEWGVDVYLKDESTHLTGSLKHRLARSLFLFGLVNGWIGPTTTVVEASSGSTAVSEAYFARMLGLDFVAVVPRSTSTEKLALIEQYGGTVHFVDAASQVYSVAADLAKQTGGHYLDQFTYAERATDWRGNNNIAESILEQLELEPHPVPEWVVVGAGTGGTSATIGRYLRYNCLQTRLAVVDPENSAFLPAWETGSTEVTGEASRIEGIGRPRAEPSFVPSVVDRMFPVPDAASIAAMLHLHETTGLSAGPSTGTNLWGVWHLVAEMIADGRKGSIVSLLCDSGIRYGNTYYDADWRRANGLEPDRYRPVLDGFFATGTWPLRKPNCQDTPKRS